MRRGPLRGTIQWPVDPKPCIICLHSGRTQMTTGGDRERARGLSAAGSVHTPGPNEGKTGGQPCGGPLGRVLGAGGSLPPQLVLAFSRPSSRRAQKASTQCPGRRLTRAPTRAPTATPEAGLQATLCRHVARGAHTPTSKHQASASSTARTKELRRAWAPGRWRRTHPAPAVSPRTGCRPCARALRKRVVSRPLGAPTASLGPAGITRLRPSQHRLHLEASSARTTPVFALS